MPRRGEGDEPDAPDGGGAAARLQQFLEARGLEETGQEHDDSGETGSGAGPGDDQEHDSGGLAGQEPQGGKGPRGQGRQSDEEA